MDLQFKTSGFFNAGLTPCSHTTTTRVLIRFTSLVNFISCVLLSLNSIISWVSLYTLWWLLLNTLPGVSTHNNSLVVVVCEHGVSPALKSPEFFKSFVAFFFLFHDRLSCSFVLTSFDHHQFKTFKNSQSFLW